MQFEVIPRTLSATFNSNTLTATYGYILTVTNRNILKVTNKRNTLTSIYNRNTLAAINKYRYLKRNIQTDINLFPFRVYIYYQNSIIYNLKDSQKCIAEQTIIISIIKVA